MGIMDLVLPKYLAMVNRRFKEPHYGLNVGACVHSVSRADGVAITSQQREEDGDKQSILLRQQGNVYFETKKFHLAQVLYTKSIAAAIEGPVCALAFANRSAALFHMNLYEDALRDIQRAFANGYPEDAMHKLYVREARCLKYLKRNYEESLKKAVQNIEEFQKGSSIALKAVAAEIEGREPFFAEKLPKGNDWTLPSLSYGVSQEVPSFSCAVTVCQNKELGRHLIANRDINTGDVLVVDKSIAATLKLDKRSTHCTKCLKYCPSLIPCRLRGNALYCSEECRDNDVNFADENLYKKTFEKYPDDYSTDKFEREEEVNHTELMRVVVCCLEQLIKLFGMQNLQELVRENKSLGENLKEPIKRFQDGTFTNNLQTLFTLNDDSDNLDPDIEKTYSMFVFQCAGIHFVPEDEVIPLSALLLKMFLTICSNLQSSYYTVVNKKGMITPGEVGLSLNLASLLVNHSCIPNMHRICYGSTVVFRAMRPIKKGEQLTEAYDGVSFLMKPLNLRKRYCRNVLHFICRCEACANRWPEMKELPRLSEKNEEVREILLASGIDPKKKGEFKKFCYFLEEGDTFINDEMLPKFAKLLDEMHMKDLRNNQWYFQLQEAIKRYYLVKGNSEYRDSKDKFPEEKTLRMSLMEICK